MNEWMILFLNWMKYIDVIMRKIDDEHFVVNVEVAVCGQFIG